MPFAAARIRPVCLLATTGAVLACAAPAQAKEVVVRFKSTASGAEVRAALRAAGVGTVRTQAGGVTVARLRRGTTAAGALESLRGRRAVAWASRNYRARIAGPPPNDTGLARAAGPPGGWQALQWDLVGPFGINVPGAWDVAQAAGAPGGRHVRIAVIDTGVAYADRRPYRRSPDLPAGRIRRGYDFVDRDPYPLDGNGHGTFVASTIAAAANNGFGMVGVAYKADIVPVRVLDERGESSSAIIAEGIRFAVDRGARVINASIELFREVGLFEVRGMSITAAPEIRSALRYAHRRGVVVVAAAGNLAQADVPSRRLGDALIYVGGTTEHGCVGDYSNHGPGLDLVAPGGGGDAAMPGDPNCQPDAAPGRNIFQVTFRRPAYRRFVVPDEFKGTSMAAPHVSGVVALLVASRALGSRPAPEQVQDRLLATARDLGSPGRDSFYGAGLVDATAALVGTPTTSG